VKVTSPVTQPLIARRATTDLFSREAVEALARTNHEPDWLREARLGAWEAAAALPYPTARERAWKYYDPERLHLEGLRPVGARPRLMQVGRAAAAEAAEALRDQSVTFTTLDAAVRERPELVRRHLGSVVPATENPFVALNAALWHGGLFVHVPRDTRVDLPLHALLSLTDAGVGLFPRLLVVLERGAEAVLLDERAGGRGVAFVSAVTEIVLADDAKLQHLVLQQWGPEVQEVFFQRAELGRAAELLTGHVGLGGVLAKGWIESLIRGGGARSDILGAVYGTDGQHFDVITLQDHYGDHSLSDLLIKSALRDRAVSAYYGLTRINRSARMADANQEDRNLLLSDKAKAEADPVLEILTSEVARCAHGASAGPVDPEQLFYLETRGLPRPQAERLLVQGFLGQVLGRVPHEAVRAHLERAVLAKLGG
jgi:Fe-S cluster assembly protein SufD